MSLLPATLWPALSPALPTLPRRRLRFARPGVRSGLFFELGHNMNDEQVLVHLGRRVLAARDGRGEWRPMRNAIARMTANGTSILVAARSAAAVVQIASEIRDGKLPRARSQAVAS